MALKLKSRKCSLQRISDVTCYNFHEPIFNIYQLHSNFILYSCCRMNLESRRSCNGLRDIGELGGASCSTINPEQFSGGSLWQPVNYDDDMCRIDDNDDLAFGTSTKFRHSLLSSDCNQVKH